MTAVVFYFLQLLSNENLSDLFLSAYPTKLKLSQGYPDIERAVVTEHGPAIPTTFI